MFDDLLPVNVVEVLLLVEALWLQRACSLQCVRGARCELQGVVASRGYVLQEMGGVSMQKPEMCKTLTHINNCTLCLSGTTLIQRLN